MTKEVFDRLVEEIRAESMDTLVRKNKKYAAGEDKLHNFKAGAEIGGGTAAQACWGYLVKHLVALRDKIERNDFSDKYDLLEKCKDVINYIVFIWCIGNEKEMETSEWKCETCIHYPPSSFDGKPCCACDPNSDLFSSYSKKEGGQ